MISHIEGYSCQHHTQVVDEMRGKGVGKFLMQVAQLIGARSDMKKVMVSNLNFISECFTAASFTFLDLKIKLLKLLFQSLTKLTKL